MDEKSNSDGASVIYGSDSDPKEEKAKQAFKNAS